MGSDDEKEKDDFLLDAEMWLKEQKLCIEENELNLEHIVS